MERSPILKDWKDQHCKNDHLTKSNSFARFCRFNAIPIKIPTQFFIESERAMYNFIWNNKRPRIAKSILNNKKTSAGITIPDLKLYYKAIVLKTAWYWYRNRHEDQWNRIEDLEMSPHVYGHLIFDKGGVNIQWKNDSLFNKWCWSNRHSACRRMKIDPFLSPCTKLENIHTKPETLKLLEEKVGKILEHIGTGENFLNRRAMAHAIR